MIGQLYGEDTKASIAQLLRNPPPEQQPSFSTASFLSAGVKGLPQAALEVGGSISDAFAAWDRNAEARSREAMRPGGPADAPEEKARREAAQRRMDAMGNAMRRKATEMSPDPQTAHTADLVVNGVTRPVSKAILYALTMGGVPGAAAFGADEGNTTYNNLRAQGIDHDTALKMAGVVGTVSAVSAGLPVAGKTLAATAGLAVAGGPAAYVAQETLSRDILKKAGYDAEAATHDPTDPLGLVLSTVLPLATGGIHMRSVGKRAKKVAEGGLPLQQMTLTERQGLKYSDARLDEFAEAAAEAHGVPPAILLAIKNAGEKSGPTATSPKGAKGVMQFMPATAKEMGIADPTDPVQSIDGAARYMRKLYDAYGSWDAAVAHYNGGGSQAAIVRGGGKPTFPETAAYLERVKKYAGEHMAEKGAADPAVVDAARVKVTEEVVARSLPAHPSAYAEVMAAADEVAAGRVPAVESPSEPLRFTTAKGSEYEVAEDGTTTRNKAARNDAGHEGDFGIKPPSEATYYVTPEQAVALGEFQTQGGPAKEVARLPDGRIGVRYVEGKDAGLFEARTVVQPHLAPEVGLHPVEVWQGGRTVHFGNEITQVHRPAGRNAKPDWVPESPGKLFEARAEDTPPGLLRPSGQDQSGVQSVDRFAPSSPSGGNALPEAGSPSLEVVAAKTAAPKPVDLQRLKVIETEQPNLLVKLPGTDETVTLDVAMQRAQAEYESEVSIIDLVRVAAECALANGG